MSKVQIQTELDPKSLIAGLTNFKIAELEAFARELNGLIYRKKSSDQSFRERSLLSQINRTVLDKKKREHYLELADKLEAETISKKEHQEYMTLAAEEEEIRNERARLLIELSQLRNIPLAQLMEEIGLKPF